MSIGTAPKKRMVPWIVLAAWLLGMSAGFWHFESRPQNSFAPNLLMSPVEPAKHGAAGRWFRESIGGYGNPRDAVTATVVHVYRDGCECNRFTEPHLAEIVARFGGRGVRFVRVEINSALAHGIPDWVSSLPAAFVFGADDQLLYFGPYSDAAWCGRSGALVEGVLERAFQGLPPQPLAATPRGCFCGPDNKSGLEEST